VTVAGCESCGHTVESTGQRGFFGEAAGPCPSCGRLMLWMTSEDGAALREANSSDGLTRAVERVREAASTLGPRASASPS
jgi:tRNA(Ile2) C34 agmatinyltransferase TiaS